MINDFDFIKNKFDNDGVTAPESISEKAIADMLEDKPHLKFRKKPLIRKAAAVAACIALLIGILPFALSEDFNSNLYISEISGADIAGDGLKAFSSYDEIKAYTNANLKSFGNNRFYIGGLDEIVGTASGDGYAGIKLVYTGLHGKTYTQVKNVDEEDILKNNGRYIFYAIDGCEVLIYDGDKLAGKISKRVSDSDEYEYINGLYLSGDKLVINSDSEKYYGKKVITTAKTYIYDVSNVKRPRLLHEFSQSGSYLASRMIGSQLYVVSNKYSNGYGYKGYISKEDCYIYLGKDGRDSILSAESVMNLEAEKSSNMLVVSSVNIDTAERSSESMALFGCGADIYCSEKNLYIAANDFKNETKIIKISLEDSMKASVSESFSGYIHNQFSMDEKDGYFRIATTDENGNNLYIFDSELKKAGEITGLAKDEQIKAARYINNMCYLITYEQTDPLFVIDVSNPEKPAVKGKVEITGFSSMLHPVDSNTLLGIGYGEDNKDMKLVLFDISNAAEPKVLDSCVIKDSYSYAQVNHRALSVNTIKDYIAFDYTKYYSENYEAGAIMINVKNNKINILKQQSISYGQEFIGAERVTYIGDKLYVLDGRGKIYSFDV